MFKKLQRQIDRKKAGAQSIKYRFDLHLAGLEGLPKSVKECRIVWARGAKVQLSKIVQAKDGTATFQQQLSQVATVYRDPRNQLEAKLRPLYINFENADEEVTIPVKLKVGSSATAYIKVNAPINAYLLLLPGRHCPGIRFFAYLSQATVRATMLRGYVTDDGMTE
eukprot:scaffold230555_cov44-Prasinocladus_malaysianus.AAC.1